MLSADECVANAAMLTCLADDALPASLKAHLLESAERWLDLSRVAERQDALIAALCIG